MIFELEPQKHANRIAKELHASAQPDSRRKLFRVTQEELHRLLHSIKEELAYPTQEVKDIVACHATEADLREYLSDLAKHLETLMAE